MAHQRHSRHSVVEGIPLPSLNPDHWPSAHEDRVLSPGQTPHTAADKNGPPSSRFRLRISAEVWRALQYVGICVHFLSSPRPPSPSFTRVVPSVIARDVGHFMVQVYTPAGYARAKAKGDAPFPVVVNFHGGGFTLGTGTDDARFARFVLERCNAVFISVDYRLAPEFPFPTAVEDGADALLYVIRNAADLHVDPHRIAISGFSAGGNLALTAPLRLHSYLKAQRAKLPPQLEPEHKLVAVASWYPVTNFTISRAQRREWCKRPDRTLPPILTDLFDASYLHPPTLDLADPHLSPAMASDEMLRDALPDNVIMYTCEWDMLLREGEDFAGRLAAEPINKTMMYKEIDGVPHGWDKGPSPFSPPEGSEELYAECCQRLKEIFEERSDPKVDGVDGAESIDRPRDVHVEFHTPIYE